MHPLEKGRAIGSRGEFSGGDLVILTWLYLLCKPRLSKTLTPRADTKTIDMDVNVF